MLKVLSNKELEVNAEALNVLNKQLERLLRTLNSIDDTKAFDNFESLKQAENALKSYDKLLKSHKATQKQLAESQKELARRQKETPKITETQINSFDDLNAAYKRSKKEMDSLSETINGKLNPEFEKSQKLTAQLKQRVDEYRRTQRELSRVIGISSDSIEGLRSQLRNNIRSYDRLSEAQRKNEAVGGKLLENIENLDEKLKELEGTTGRFQRNVGNYESALEGLRSELGLTEKETFSLNEQQRAQIQVLSDLESEYKTVVEFLGENSKEAKDLRREINRLNRQLKQNEGRFRRSVRQAKEYAKASKSVQTGLKGIQLAGGTVLAVLGAVIGVFGQGRDGGAQFEAVLDTVKNTLSTLSKSFQELFDNIKEIVEYIRSIDLNPFNDDDEKTIKETGEAVEDVAGAWENANTQIEAQRRLIVTLDIEQNKLQRSTTKLRDEVARLTQVANDDTAAINDKIAANNQLIKKQSELAKQDEQLAGLNLARANQDLAIEINRGAIALQRADFVVQATNTILNADGTLTDNISENAKRQAEAYALRLRNRQLAGQVTEATEAKFTETFVALEQARTDAVLAAFEIQKNARQLTSDQTEQVLDILEAQFDQINDTNDKLVNDERLSLDQRKSIQKENENNLKNFLDTSIGLLEDVSGVVIDFDRIRNESDAQRTAQLIKDAGLSETLTTRLIQLVNIRRTAQIGLDDSNKELAKSETELAELRAENNRLLADSIKPLRKLNAEMNAELEKVRNDEKLSEEKRGEAISKIIDKYNQRAAELQRNAERKRLKERINANKELLNELERGSIEFEKLQEVIYKDELSLLKDQLKREKVEKDKASEIDTKRAKIKAKKEQEIVKASFAVFNSLSEKLSNDRVKGVENQLNALDRQQTALQAQAAKGNREALESLATQERERVRLESRKEQIEKRAQKRALVLATVESYTSELAASKNPSSALAKTVANIGLLEAVISALPTFYTGTETTIADSLGAPNLNTQKDGYIVRVDGSEMVLNPEQSNEVLKRGYTSSDLVNLAKYHSDLNEVKPVIKANAINIEPVVSSIEGLRREFADIPRITEGFDNIEGLILEIIKRGNYVKVNKRKAKIR